MSVVSSSVVSPRSALPPSQLQVKNVRDTGRRVSDEFLTGGQGVSGWIDLRDNSLHLFSKTTGRCKAKPEGAVDWFFSKSSGLSFQQYDRSVELTESAKTPVRSALKSGVLVYLKALMDMSYHSGQSKDEQARIHQNLVKRGAKYLALLSPNQGVVDKVLRGELFASPSKPT
jgi:hypothetical protein